MAKKIKRSTGVYEEILFGLLIIFGLGVLTGRYIEHRYTLSQLRLQSASYKFSEFITKLSIEKLVKEKNSWKSKALSTSREVIPSCSIKIHPSKTKVSSDFFIDG